MYRIRKGTSTPRRISQSICVRRTTRVYTHVTLRAVVELEAEAFSEKEIFQSTKRIIIRTRSLRYTCYRFQGYERQLQFLLTFSLQGLALSYDIYGCLSFIAQMCPCLNSTLSSGHLKMLSFSTRFVIVVTSYGLCVIAFRNKMLSVRLAFLNTFQYRIHCTHALVCYAL
jgi:hypothetical protein